MAIDGLMKGRKKDGRTEKYTLIINLRSKRNQILRNMGVAQRNTDNIENKSSETCGYSEGIKTRVFFLVLFR